MQPFCRPRSIYLYFSKLCNHPVDLDRNAFLASERFQQRMVKLTGCPKNCAYLKILWAPLVKFVLL